MLLGIKYFSELFEGHLSSSSNDFANSLVGLDNRFVSVLIHFTPEIVQKLSVVNFTSSVISLKKMSYFFFSQEYFSTLKTPLEIILV